MNWPPDITIKQHARARHVKLKASILHGLELVVPRRFNHKEIPFILEENRVWIEKQLTKIHAQVSLKDLLPQKIQFASINRDWSVDYICNQKKNLRLIARPHQYEIVLFGDIKNKQVCKKLLLTWIKKQARFVLLEKLNQISQETQLFYQKLAIRDQKSRWGSCSSSKAINLNYKLLFLPYHLMRHVIIHELCHTVYLNHSEKFWQLVAKFDPLWKEHKLELRNAENFIPPWCFQ